MCFFLENIWVSVSDKYYIVYTVICNSIHLLGICITCNRLGKISPKVIRKLSFKKCYKKKWPYSGVWAWIYSLCCEAPSYNFLQPNMFIRFSPCQIYRIFQPALWVRRGQSLCSVTLLSPPLHFKVFYVGHLDERRRSFSGFP